MLRRTKNSPQIVGEHLSSTTTSAVHCSSFYLTFSCLDGVAILFIWWYFQDLHDSVQQTMDDLKAWAFVVINST